MSFPFPAFLYHRSVFPGNGTECRATSRLELRKGAVELLAKLDSLTNISCVCDLEEGAKLVAGGPGRPDGLSNGFFAGA